MKRYRKNWTFFGVVFLLLGGSYLLFKRDIYLYVCEKENNAPACFLLSDLYHQDGDSSRAQKYLELSCQNKYEIACTKLGKGAPDDLSSPIVK